MISPVNQRRQERLDLVARITLPVCPMKINQMRIYPHIRYIHPWLDGFLTFKEMHDLLVKYGWVIDNKFDHMNKTIFSTTPEFQRSMLNDHFANCDWKWDLKDELKCYNLQMGDL